MPRLRGRGVTIEIAVQLLPGHGRRQATAPSRCNIPAGIMDGQRLQMRGRGHAGRSWDRPRGDLYVGVRGAPAPQLRQRDGSTS